jgi:hypothetical protein
MQNLISNAEILLELIRLQGLEEIIQEEQTKFFDETDPERKLIYQSRISEARKMKIKFLTILN